MKKWIISIIVLCLLISVGMFYSTKQSVNAHNVVLSNQVFNATFSSAISEADWEKGDIYVKNQQGKKIDVDYELSDNGKYIEIPGLSEGTYTMFMKKKYGMGKTRVQFNVFEDIQPVNSRAELTAYFDLVKKVQGNGKEDKVTTETEESSVLSVEAKDSSSSRGGDYSTTNNQVEGVDEADMVKTNGSHIFSISENNVVIVNVEDSVNMKEEAKIRFTDEFYPNQLLLSDKTLMVIGQKNNIPLVIEADNTEEKEQKSTEETKKIAQPIDSMTTVYFYDISNPKHPQLLREIATEGYMVGARLTDNILYYVTSVYPRYSIMEGNEDVELRPYTHDSSRYLLPKPLSYSDISILPSTLVANYSVITAIDVENLLENKVITKAYLGGSEQLYMSQDNLYLTSTYYDSSNTNQNAREMIWNPGKMDTEVFKFALNNTSVEFVGSSRLSGTILNQFSMDEHDGYFRAVTTKGNRWDENEVSENNLFILDNKMKQVGSLTGLAKDERIYSARFMGDKAYMVTFKETDPLFVIDVATPSAPKVLGELKIPGFSNYLHPLDENHLIGFGYETKVVPQEGSKEPRIMTEGMKISLFDVTDLANPKELDTEIIGEQGTYSAIQHDHHALFQHRDKNLYGFPVSIYGKEEGQEYNQFKQDGALIYEITPEKGIVLKGDLLKPENPAQLYEDWEEMIQRILYVEDSLYTIAMKEIKRYNLNTYEEIGKLAY
ncbi:beta-propeller domain-containing protein [Psychrobacillus sp. FSL H8-0484]|uniref:beta-propeller domain-containing protein n=1 Tax=Psychrobacillus sp. FSL H8-0484 TaxID=2921390 RepID=UPI0030F501B6